MGFEGSRHVGAMRVGGANPKPHYSCLSAQLGSPHRAPKTSPALTPLRRAMSQDRVHSGDLLVGSQDRSIPVTFFGRKSTRAEAEAWTRPQAQAPPARSHPAYIKEEGACGVSVCGMFHTVVFVWSGVNGALRWGLGPAGHYAGGVVWFVVCWVCEGPVPIS